MLGVVEDFAGVGFWDPGVVFAEGRVERDFIVEFDAVGLDCSESSGDWNS